MVQLKQVSVYSPGKWKVAKCYGKREALPLVVNVLHQTLPRPKTKSLPSIKVSQVANIDRISYDLLSH